MIINSRARRAYNLKSPLIDQAGRVDLTSFHTARTVCHQVNTMRDTVASPEELLRAGELYGFGMLDRLYRSILRKQLVGGTDLSQATLKKLLPDGESREALLEMVNREFPPEPEGPRPAEEIIADLLLVRLANENPAAVRIRELIDDSGLEHAPAYTALQEKADDLFSAPLEAQRGEKLLQMLRRPFMLHPNSVKEQLEYIRIQWEGLIGDALMPLLGALDFLNEEERPFFGGGPGEQHAYVYSGGDNEGFSPDQDWMPTVVMIAKNVLVWLHQLSIEYGQSMNRLDDIPDEALDRLAKRGFTALWLIGVWQRSRASKRIKHLCGNFEAEASAYSLRNYEINPDLGGSEALEVLRIKAAKRGIRLASDMVPNHTGIDADWIYEHPEYYIQTPMPPYPSYTFSGENLSDREGVGIYLEDHYYDRTDAAVVFKHVDLSTNRVRYIYHGNDGTHMPWNDTAQLNYLRSEVREAVIETIIQVARKFPIIRFDAAMTLARQHIRRLWYPEPGQGGAVPSRAEHALSAESFNSALPEEFWREVVDRVAAEIPGTLLLAEAFWMMEGYFVRTLGMHRVYNSAFMNMLKNEENDKYRQTLKNTLEFDREILKRFVNFMNNPDEETAIAQFGSGDKYFGVCTMLATMPGLPMFGHGQIEGLTEKYGMEYRRAYRDEKPDAGVVARHEKEIFPLLKRRPLFSEVEFFTLFDFIGPAGINQNVFAYTNRSGGDAVLVLYNNSSAPAAGTIRISIPFRDKSRGGELRQRTLGEALGVPDNPRKWLILRQHATNLEFVRNCRDIARHGLEAVLPEYGCQVYLDLRIVDDDREGRYRRLAEHLNGAGCISVDREIRILHMKPLHAALAEALAPRIIEVFRQAMLKQEKPPENFLQDWKEKYRRFLAAAGESTAPLPEESAEQKEQAAEAAMLRAARSVLHIATFNLSAAGNSEEELAGFRGYLVRGFEMRSEAPAVLAAWCLTEKLGTLFGGGRNAAVSRSLIDDWHLGTPLRDIFSGTGLKPEKADYAVSLVKLLTSFQEWHSSIDESNADEFLAGLLHELEIQDFLLVNRYNKIVWFSKDRFEDMLWWFFCIAAVVLAEQTEAEYFPRIKELFAILHRWFDYEEESGYQLEKLTALLSGEAPRNRR